MEVLEREGEALGRGSWGGSGEDERQARENGLQFKLERLAKVVSPEKGYFGI